MTFEFEEVIQRIEKLEGAYAQLQKELEIYKNHSKLEPAQEPSFLHEASIDYGKRKGYSYKDYLALPEERRVELIDGVFYDMSAPTTIHQAISGSIYKKLLDYVLEKKGDCTPFISPVDVLLDEDDRTVVQPDVLVVCDRNKLQKGVIVGAPDLVVEVLSPSTRKKDMQLKIYKYGNAGVKEYWMIDPVVKKVIVYDFEHEAIPVIYTFEDVIPLMIWDGECKIDFADLEKNFDFLYDHQR